MDSQLDNSCPKTLQSNPKPVENSLFTKKNINFLPVLITFFAGVFIFGAGGYFLGRQSAITQKVIPSERPAIRPRVSPIVNIKSKILYSSDWQTFNGVNDFSFKYPSDWTDQISYLQSSDKFMEIWIEGDTLGLTCLVNTKTESKVVNSITFDLEYYSGLKSENCDTAETRTIFIPISTNNSNLSFTFSYNSSN